MELQLVAHVSTNEEGETVAVKKITVEETNFIVIQQGTTKSVVHLDELKQAISKLEEFNSG